MSNIKRLLEELQGEFLAIKELKEHQAKLFAVDPAQLLAELNRDTFIEEKKAEVLVPMEEELVNGEEWEMEGQAYEDYKNSEVQSLNAK